MHICPNAACSLKTFNLGISQIIEVNSLPHKMLQKTAMYACYIFDCQLSQWQVHQIIDRSPKKVETHNQTKKTTREPDPTNHTNHHPLRTAVVQFMAINGVAAKETLTDMDMTWSSLGKVDGWMDEWMGPGDRDFFPNSGPQVMEKKNIYIYINPFREMGLMIFPSSLPEMHQEFKRCLASPKNVTRAGKTSETETRNLNEITHPIQNLAGKSTKQIGEKYIYS